MSKTSLKKQKWRPLEEGDVVDVVAPGRSCSLAELRGAKKFLESWGLKPRIPQNIFSNHYLCSNTDKFRFQHLKKSLLDKKSKAIWCVRGGYGSIRLLPELSKMPKPKNSKLLIGYSDISTLHLFVSQQWNWTAVHGPFLDRLGTGNIRSSDLKEIKKVAFGLQDQVLFTNFQPINRAARRSAQINATVMGGNLATFCSSLGTPWQLDVKNKILIIEDIGEYGHAIDRMLQQMSQAQVFKNLKALVFGEFIGGQQPSGQFLWKKVFNEFAQHQKFPVFQNLKVGHGPIQRTLPVNSAARLTTGKRPHLIVDSGFQS